MKLRSFHRLRSAYTLIEVLAAGAIISVGMTAAVSLTSSLMAQEELAWRTAITRNYQENMVRLWQLGLSDSYSKDPTNITAVMPRQSYSPRLNEAILGEPALIESKDTTSPEGLGPLKVATVQATVNTSKDPKNEFQDQKAGSFSFYCFRPSLPTSLRTVPLE